MRRHRDPGGRRRTVGPRIHQRLDVEERSVGLSEGEDLRERLWPVGDACKSELGCGRNQRGRLRRRWPCPNQQNQNKYAGGS